MANLHVNHHYHHILSLPTRVKSHFHVNNNNKKPPIPHNPHKRWQKGGFKISSTTSGGSGGGAVVEQRPTMADAMVGDLIDQTGDIGFDDNDDDEKRVVVDEYLVKEYGWEVRRMVEEMNEMRKVAEIQAQAFHDPAPFLDDFFFNFFKAEVLSALSYKLRNSPPDRYACLVAEGGEDEEDKVVAGVVDVTVLRDNDVVQHLEGAQEYLYVSGIAVSNNFRRQKVGTVLLKACEVIAVLWRYEYVVLKAYEDDIGPRTLYSNAGYRLVSSDPPWLAWFGRRRRVILIKRLC